MNTRFDPRLNREILEIYPGEFYAARGPCVISTVLGSCVSVALHDSVDGIGGMNHFMLPGRLGQEKIYVSNAGKYGMFAMELLINEMIKIGAKKKAMIAKVFGGGKVLKALLGASGNVADSNVSFAMEFLSEEGIPVSSSDVGGTLGRRILFFTEDARVLLKRLSYIQDIPLVLDEDKYLTRLQKQKEEKKGRVTLF
jgi:chemotaxis protein CheD